MIIVRTKKGKIFGINAYDLLNLKDDEIKKIDIITERAKR
jgi:hypothetical protein